MRGRKPKPTVLKLLDGNPGKRPLNDREPAAPSGNSGAAELARRRGPGEWFRTVEGAQRDGPDEPGRRDGAGGLLHCL